MTGVQDQRDISSVVASLVAEDQRGLRWPTYATLLPDHVTLTCQSVDRTSLQGYVPSCSR